MRDELLQLLLLLLLLVWHFGDAVVMVPFSHGNDYGCFHCSCTCIIIVKYLLSCLKLLFFSLFFLVLILICWLAGHDVV